MSWRDRRFVTDLCLPFGGSLDLIFRFKVISLLVFVVLFALFILLASDFSYFYSSTILPLFSSSS